MGPDLQTESVQIQNPRYCQFHSPPLSGTIEEGKECLRFYYDQPIKG